MNAASPAAPRVNVGKTLFEMFGGALFGAGITYAYLINAAEARVADIVALGCAMICVIAAIRLFGESFDAKALAKRLDVEGEGTPKEAGSVRVQAAMMVSLAIALIWPPLATLNGGAASPWAYAVTFVFTALNVIYSVRMYQRGDEFVRRTYLVATFWSSMVGQGLLLFYAGAERLGLVVPLTAWDVLIAFTAISIVTPLFVTARKH